MPCTVTIKIGEYKNLSNCDIVMISVVRIMQDQNRLSELKDPVSIAESFIGEVVLGGFNKVGNGILLLFMQSTS